MSSLLYQLSYNLDLFLFFIINYADEGFAPSITGHEPIMLLLHQPACNNNLPYKAQCKYRTYFYRLQNGCITFMLTGLYSQNAFTLNITSVLSRIFVSNQEIQVFIHRTVFGYKPLI